MLHCAGQVFHPDGDLVDGKPSESLFGSMRSSHFLCTREPCEGKEADFEVRNWFWVHISILLFLRIPLGASQWMWQGHLPCPRISLCWGSNERRVGGALQSIGHTWVSVCPVDQRTDLRMLLVCFWLNHGLQICHLFRMFPDCPHYVTMV